MYNYEIYVERERGRLEGERIAELYLGTPDRYPI